ncbi:glycolipid-anchored surface protein [Lipomyces oligophaga]|uniref:glycolipid-anchored surface protein n=1 Tax=Lipomyces oligophaga TaxID=45792 RepID=UPI0034CF77D2
MTRISNINRAVVMAVALLVSFADALLPISVKDNMFINYDGTPFTIVGVDYQPGGSSDYSNSASSDVLSVADVCLRDAYALQQLGVNTIRVYTVSPWLNHDECMSIFNAVGIYVILDVNSPLGGESIQRDDPAASYNEGYLKRVFAILDAFMGYGNVLGFFAGNEVFNDDTSAKVSPPYIRAVQRDIKNYIAKHGSREIPVGYSAADVASLRIAGWEYLQCGSGNGTSSNTTDLDKSRSDFYGLNSYSWCSGVSTWQTSGYGTLQSTFANSSIPLFFSEYGCNTDTPRTFDEVSEGLYTQTMMKSFDGGLVYEYSEEDNQYGLVTIDSDGSITYKTDFENLRNQIANLTFSNWYTSNYLDNVTVPKCNRTYIESLDSSFNASLSIPSCPAQDMLESGSGNNNVGKWVDLNATSTSYTITDADGNTVSNTTIEIVSDQTIPESESSSSSSSSSVVSSATASTSTRSSAVGSSTSITASVTSTTSASTSSSSAGAGISSSPGSFVMVLIGLVAFWV